MPIRKTNEQFTREVFEAVGNEYIFLEGYTNAKTKILAKHLECGLEYQVTPSDFIYGKRRCPKCYKEARNEKLRKTTSQFMKEVYELVKDEYKFYGEYTGWLCTMAIQHTICGYSYEVGVNNFLKGSRCPKCTKSKKGMGARTNEEFLEIVKTLVGNEYEFIEPYSRSRVKINVIHKVCGRQYSVQPNSFILGARCQKCYGKIVADRNKKTTEEYISKVEDLTGDEYDVLGEYVGSYTKIKMRHNTCYNIFDMMPNTFVHGKARCPRCNESKGEKKISAYLNELGFEYDFEQTFPDLINIRSLRYDFSIKDKEGNITNLIEYDGRQHFESVDFFGGEKSLEENKYRDKLKDEYAEKHNIPLLRIPYWEFKNIEMLLSEFLEVKEFQSVEGGEVLWQA